ncbi:MAG TPA: HAMP domain-containing sensor histidine kinase [Vicinamibacterales bacterium]|nr:HAMP domain-containing sensor histidine kinase [Vicinamibacterales bacterium]
MTPSLRRRIFTGSVLWTIGMILLASAAMSVVFDVYPVLRLPIALHVHGVLQMPLVLLAGAVCLVAGALQVRRGLARIDDLRSRLTGLRQGQERRLEGAYPGEIQPLVDDLNALLTQRDEAIRRAHAKAGDLAHGLKTPLAILAQEADSTATAGHVEVAASIRQLVERMRRQVDYHLAHARAAASGSTPGTRSSVKTSADGLARALGRLHAGRDLLIDVASPAAHCVRVEREDLDEMLGNLVDNACKWAQTRVRVDSSLAGREIVIVVDDDGPGLAEGMRAAVLRRGVRADEAVAGTGLGLAIVGDLAELYGGSVALERSPDGGCRAVLRLPAVDGDDSGEDVPRPT